MAKLFSVPSSAARKSPEFLLSCTRYFWIFSMILGFDPGRDKCGIAVVDRQKQVRYHRVVTSTEASQTIEQLCQQFPIELVVMGNLTTAKSWQHTIKSHLNSIPVVMVDERNSSLEARDRYWQMYPPTGLTKLIPLGMRLPPRPVDDIVAILLIERWMEKC